MGSTYNSVTLLGSVGREPEMRTMPSGDRVCVFSLATTRSVVSKVTGRREVTDWHTVAIFNEHLIKVAEQYVRKGTTLLVEGEVQVRKFKDKNGAEKSVTEVVLPRFDGKLRVQGAGAGKTPAKNGAAAKNPPKIAGAQA